MSVGGAELRELAGGRADLLAEVAGLAMGFSEGKGPEYEARAETINWLCRAAGTDPEEIPAWTEEGRRRAAVARMPRSSGGLRAPLSQKSTASQVLAGPHRSRAVSVLSQKTSALAPVTGPAG